jgi:hypothetical protein
MTTSAKPVKPEKAWAVVTPNGNLGHCLLGWTRRDAVRSAVERFAAPWKQLRKEGFSCAKVTIAEGW